eukprot:13153_2
MGGCRGAWAAPAAPAAPAELFQKYLTFAVVCSLLATVDSFVGPAVLLRKHAPHSLSAAKTELGLSSFAGTSRCVLALRRRGRAGKGAGLGMAELRMSLSEEDRVVLWDEIEELQSKMQTAIDQEHYEEA